MTIEDYCISLNLNNFFLVVLGVVDMCHDLLNGEHLKSKRYLADILELPRKIASLPVLPVDLR